MSEPQQTRSDSGAITIASSIGDYCDNYEEALPRLPMGFSVIRVFVGRPVMRVNPDISQVVECTEHNHDDGHSGAQKHEGEQHVSLAT